MLEQNSDALNIVSKKLLEMERKANHNKSETLWSFRVIMISTLLIPIFIAFGSNEIYGKMFPMILSSIIALFTAWIQLRKPQNLWGTYRTAHRKIEIELESYQFNLGDYDVDKVLKDKILIKNVHEIYIETHLKWMENIPTSEEVNSMMLHRENS